MRELDYKRYPILFVDDELSNLENLLFAFELDYTLITASSGAEALAIMDRKEVAVVISDQRMPEMTGTELLAKVKKRHPTAVKVLITAYADVEDVIDGISDGYVDRYIRKDQDMRHIDATIRQAIEYYHENACKKLAVGTYHN